MTACSQDPNAKKRTMFFISNTHRAGLKKLSNKTGVPMAEYVRRSIAQLLKRHGIS